MINKLKGEMFTVVTKAVEAANNFFDFTENIAHAELSGVTLAHDTQAPADVSTNHCFDLRSIFDVQVVADQSQEGKPDKSGPQSQIDIRAVCGFIKED